MVLFVVCLMVLMVVYLMVVLVVYFIASGAMPQHSLMKCTVMMWTAVAT